MIKMLLLTVLVFSPVVDARGGSGGHGGGGHSVGHVAAHSEGHVVGHSEAHSEAHVSKFSGLRTMSMSERANTIPQSNIRYHTNYVRSRGPTPTSTDPDPLLVTVCTPDELTKARHWQELCKEDDNVTTGYCSLLSYFRYCKQADLEDVQGLPLAGPNYHNVYVDSSSEH